MRRACLPLLLLSFGTCAPEQNREAYVRARKDGGWDAHCDAAYARLTGAAFSSLDAGVARRGRGVVFLVLTGVFLKVWEGVFLRSLRTMRPPMLLRRRPARCGVVFVAAGMVLAVRVSR